MQRHRDIASVVRATQQMVAKGADLGFKSHGGFQQVNLFKVGVIGVFRSEHKQHVLMNLVNDHQNSLRNVVVKILFSLTFRAPVAIKKLARSTYATIIVEPLKRLVYVAAVDVQTRLLVIVNGEVDANACVFVVLQDILYGNIISNRLSLFTQQCRIDVGWG